MVIPHSTTNKKVFVLKCNNILTKVNKNNKEGGKKGHVYIVALSVGKLMNGATLSLPDPSMGVSINKICMTKSTIAFSTSVSPSYVVSP